MQNAATNLTVIVPGFENFSKCFDGSAAHVEYAQFIREASYTVCTKICKNDNQTVIINNNTSIHKAITSLKWWKKIKLIAFLPFLILHKHIYLQKSIFL